MKGKLLFLLFSFCGFIFQAMAQGDLLITPTRVVFEGNKQREEFNLVNMGKDTTTYSISFLHYNQTVSGGYAIIEKTDSLQMSAEPYLRIFPRTVTLAPQEPQVVMVQYRRKSDMKPGEYRSHLYFRSEKDYRPLLNKNDDTLKIVMVKLIPIYGISIPVIIRTGEMKVNTSFSNLKLENQKDSIFALKLAINRAGNCSTYGDLIVDYFPAKGKSCEVGKIKGVKVFTNLNKLSVAINLRLNPGMDLKNGKLRIRYTNSDDSKNTVYTEAIIPLTEQPTIAQGATIDQKNEKGNQRIEQRKNH